jgi:hypothetical protein
MIATTSIVNPDSIFNRGLTRGPGSAMIVKTKGVSMYGPDMVTLIQERLEQKAGMTYDEVVEFVSGDRADDLEAAFERDCSDFYDDFVEEQTDILMEEWREKIGGSGFSGPNGHWGIGYREDGTMNETVSTADHKGAALWYAKAALATRQVHQNDFNWGQESNNSALMAIYYSNLAILEYIEKLGRSISLNKDSPF